MSRRGMQRLRYQTHRSHEAYRDDLAIHASQRPANKDVAKQPDLGLPGLLLPDFGLPGLVGGDEPAKPIRQIAD